MRPMRIVCGAAGCGAAVLLAVLLPLTAAAHEHREVAGGQYELTVGFLDEPAFVGEKNGLSLRVVRPAAAGGAPTAGAATEDAGTPVEGLIGTLQAEVMFGDQRMPLPLLPAFGDPGHYTSYFFPSTPGGYTFHVFGQIEGVAVDETFTSSPEGFDGVQPVEPLQFPKPATSGDVGGPAGTANTAGDLSGGPTRLLAGLSVVGAVALWLIRRAVTRRAAGAPPAPAAARP